jgi:hypothetical protein
MLEKNTDGGRRFLSRRTPQVFYVFSVWSPVYNLHHFLIRALSFSVQTIWLATLLES